MKTIFIATDFSTAARNAGVYGIELAKAFNARVILFNAWQQVAAATMEGALVLSWEEYRSYAEQELNNEINSINPGNKVQAEIAYEEGNAVETILQAASANKADLIIVGMKGTGKMMRKLLGSTATDLASKTSMPVVIVPEGAKFTNLATIALANESDIEPDREPGLLSMLREIAERFHSKLYLVRVAQNQFHEVYEVYNRPFHLQKIMRTLDPQYELIRGKNIAHALNDFIDTHAVNMLALLPHKYNAWDKLFIKSTTRSMTFETQVPLLIIPDLFEEKKDRLKETESHAVKNI